MDLINLLKSFFFKNEQPTTTDATATPANTDPNSIDGLIDTSWCGYSMKY